MWRRKKSEGERLRESERESQGEGKYGGQIPRKQREAKSKSVCVCAGVHVCEMREEWKKGKTQLAARTTEQTHLQSSARLENNYLPSPLPL